VILFLTEKLVKAHAEMKRRVGTQILNSRTQAKMIGRKLSVMIQLDDRQKISFNCSAIGATAKYLEDRSRDKLERLVSMPGSRLAYNHYRWSSLGPQLPIEGFWKERLARIPYSKEFEQNITAVREYLEARNQSEWVNEVLRYLPHNHVFNTTVYLIIDHNNIVFGEDVALNLNSRQFHADHREAVYYLIHELAHAGYLRYHSERMPELASIKTLGELCAIVKFLTHLEGMGVISSLRLRTREGGLLDNDYKVLRNEAEKAKRVREYFKVLSRLENNAKQKVKQSDFEVFEKMSGRATRLWYITGCHMAQTIESTFGLNTLRQLVEKGCSDFFKKYMSVEDPMRQWPLIQKQEKSCYTLPQRERR